jgi:hypothetical protein
VERVASKRRRSWLDGRPNMEPDEKIGLFRGLSLLPVGPQARRESAGRHLQSQVHAVCYTAQAGAEKGVFLGSGPVPVVKGAAVCGGLSCATRRSTDLRAARKRPGMGSGGEDAKQHKGGWVQATHVRADCIHLSRRRTRKDQGGFPTAASQKWTCFSPRWISPKRCPNSAHEERRSPRVGPPPTWRRSVVFRPCRMPSCSCAWAVGHRLRQAGRPRRLPRAAPRVGASIRPASPLAANQTTLAIVPSAKLTRAGGYLEKLRAKGYLSRSENNGDIPIFQKMGTFLICPRCGRKGSCCQGRVTFC